MDGITFTVHTRIWVRLLLWVDLLEDNAPSEYDIHILVAFLYCSHLAVPD